MRQLPLGNITRTLALFAAIGCVGDIPGGGGEAGGGRGEQQGGRGGSAGMMTPGTSWMAPGGSTKPGAKRMAGTLPLRRLSRAEYNNTLRDLLGESGDPANEFATDTQGSSGFDEGALVAGAELDRMVDTADKLARNVVGSSTRLATVLPCDPAKAGEEACAMEFIKSFGRRAYRHPLSADETRDLVAIYQDARNGLALDWKGGIRMVLSAMLLSPRFHYHWQLGDRPAKAVDGLVALDGYELASRLSYFLWQSMPDDALLDAAEKGELAKPEGVLKHARRMLEDPKKASRGVRGFFRGWLELHPIHDRDVQMPADKVIGPGLYTAMEAETMSFVDELFFGQGEHRFETLLTAPVGFVNETLAKVYGVAGVSGKELRRVPLDPAQRAGILTQGAFLAASYSTPFATPIRRGRFIFERLATCNPVPAPEGAIPEPPPPKDGASIRQQLGEHSENGACRGCHQMMDPMGFAFLGFDQYGRVRGKDDNGQPIDATGTIPGVANGAGLRFDGAVDLSKKLAKLPEAQRCFAMQFFRYAQRKGLDPDDEGSAAALAEVFTKSGHDLRELMMGATQVFSFYYRAPAAGEVFQ